MISIYKTVVKKPKVLDNDNIQLKLLDIISEQSPGEKIKNLYNHSEVRIALNKLYNNKCAYCEQKIPEGYSERIDHFRPKNKIRKVDNHKGYWWLGYEWTNLLPTCEKCNIKKSNKFPLKNGENTRISDNLENEEFLQNKTFNFSNFKIDRLEKEERLLLKPEIDKVEEHLFFIPTGEIKYLTEKGEKSIEVYDLNRNSLILERRRIIDEVINDIIDIFSNYEQHTDLLKKLFKNKVEYTEEKDYSFFRFFIKYFFNSFVVLDLENLQFSDISKILINEYEKRITY